MGVYSKLAREAVEYFVKHGQPMPVPSVLSPDMGRQKACYVTFFEEPGHRVRSMYGAALPQYATLAQEILGHAGSALQSEQMRKITRPDLSGLRYSVALLGTLQRISDEQHLEPMRFGLYLVSDRGKHNLQLPQRVGIETGGDQIATALRESHINLQEESVIMYRFEVEYDDE